MVGVIGDEGTEHPKLIVGYFISSESVAVIDGKMRIYLSEKHPYVVFDVLFGRIDKPGWDSSYRGRVPFKSGKEPQYYYPTFDRPLDEKEPENTFKKRCAGLIMKRAKEVCETERTNKDAQGALGRYSQAARNFMGIAEDLFELNWP